MLIPNQSFVFQEIIKAIEVRQEKRIILQGSAGTGKTYLVKCIVEYFASKIKKWDSKKVFVTAPTNKALSVLKEKIDVIRGVTFKTTHSALKLRKKENPRTGVVNFIPEWGDYSRPFEDCVLAFVDECSMLNTALIEYLDAYNFPIIFVGDSKQINPVGELNIPIFHRTYPVYELTEIVRQGAGNPIIDLSRNLDLIWSREDKLIEDKGYIFNNSKDTIFQNLAEVNGTDELKYLTWMVNDAEYVNKAVRNLIYDKPAKLQLGETIIFKRPYGSYYNNQIITIKSLDVVERTFFYPTANYTIKKGKVSGEGSIKLKVYLVNGEVYILHEDSEPTANLMASTIVKNCNSQNWDWRGYYRFIEQFASITYNHAITIHKSQGSTYKEAILNVGITNLNPTKEERERLFYTAVTRASDLLILTNVK